MAEATQHGTAEESVPTETLRVVVIGDRKLLRLKSWLSISTTNHRPVELAGQPLPSTVGDVTSGSFRVLCIGPAEWLLVSTVHSIWNLRTQIESDQRSQGLSLADLTDGLAVFEVQGLASRAVLSKGCALDLHPKVFPAGHCARTRFAQMPVVIDCIDTASRFELYVARSYADFLHEWLLDAAVEFEAATV